MPAGAEPAHVHAGLGHGVLHGAPSPAGHGRCIGYLTKYLTKHVSDCHQASTEDQAAHADWLAASLRYEPCSPTCANCCRAPIYGR